MSPSLHVLLVAYQCGPDMGSVSQIGWQWFLHLAARERVTLVTHERNRVAIEAAPDRPANATIVYIDTEWFAGPRYRGCRRLFPRSEHAVFMLSQLDWFVFDAVALRRLRQHRKLGADWDLLHLVTPVTTSAPSRLHRLGPPVVRGPLNCGLGVPTGFADLMRSESLGLARLRLFPRLLEGVWGSLRACRAVLVATESTYRSVPASARSRCVRMIENGVEAATFEARALSTAAPGAERTLRVCFVGRLVAVKALSFLIEAMARLRTQGLRVELTVAGSGPMEAPWRALAQRMGVAQDIRWLGNVPHADVPRVMQEAQLLCLPSVRESGGAVLLEAMACGRPVMAMDYGGPAEIVDAEVGWKIPATNATEAVERMAAALRDIHRQPEVCAVKGEAARARVRHRHTWAAKVEQARQLYREVVLAA